MSTETHTVKVKLLPFSRLEAFANGDTIRADNSKILVAKIKASFDCDGMKVKDVRHDLGCLIVRTEYR